MIYPKPLAAGDAVGLIAPSGPTEYMEDCLRQVRRMGFEPVAGKSCYSKEGYLAGPDHIRAKDVNDMFADPQIAGIFAVRGGYGCQRILDSIDWPTVGKNPKVFAGSSDVTVLHTAINQRCGFVSYHSPMFGSGLWRDVTDPYTIGTFLNCVCGDYTAYNEQNWGYFHSEASLAVLSDGEAEGQLSGGNLAMVCASLGTPWEIDAQNKIIFLEDIHEAPYRIDRMLCQLKLAGKLEQAAGFILGTFTGCEAADPEKSRPLEDIFAEYFSPLKKPCYTGFACGHSLPTATLPLGAVVQMAKGAFFIK